MNAYSVCRRATLCIALLTTAVIQGCANAESEKFEQLRSANAKLVDQVADLESKLEEIEHGPARLLARAKQQEASGSFEQLEETAAEILKRHAGTPEAGEVASLVERVKEAKRRTQLERERLATESMRSMRKKYDEIRGVTTYDDRRTSTYAKQLKLFFEQADDGTLSRPRVVLSYYHPRTWVFYSDATIKADDKQFVYHPETTKRDNVGRNSDCWEWGEKTLDERDLEMLRAVAGSKKTIIRYNGERTSDFIVPESQKVAIRNTLAAFEALGGKLP